MNRCSHRGSSATGDGCAAPWEPDTSVDMDERPMATTWRARRRILARLVCVALVVRHTPCCSIFVRRASCLWSGLSETSRAQSLVADAVQVDCGLTPGLEAWRRWPQRSAVKAGRVRSPGSFSPTTAARFHVTRCDTGYTRHRCALLHGAITRPTTELHARDHQEIIWPARTVHARSSSYSGSGSRTEARDERPNDVTDTAAILARYTRYSPVCAYSLCVLNDVSCAIVHSS